MYYLGKTSSQPLKQKCRFKKKKRCVAISFHLCGRRREHAIILWYSLKLFKGVTASKLIPYSSVAQPRTRGRRRMENHCAHTNELNLQPVHPFSHQAPSHPRAGGSFCNIAFCLHSLFLVPDWTYTLKTSGRSVHSLLGPGRQSGAKCKSRSNFLTTSLVGSSFSDPEGVSTQQQNAYRFQLSVTNKGDILLQACSEVWSQTGRRSVSKQMLCV